MFILRELTFLYFLLCFILVLYSEERGGRAEERREGLVEERKGRERDGAVYDGEEYKGDRREEAGGT